MFGEVLEELRQLEKETFDIEHITDAEEKLGLAFELFHQLLVQHRLLQLPH